MMKFIYFLAAFLNTACLIPQSQAAVSVEEQAAQDFVTDIGNQVIQILIDKSKPLSARQEAFRQVIKSHFDLKGIGRFVLGRYWRQANEAQQEQYLQLFEDSIVESYSHQFDNYRNEVLKVENARSTDKGGIVVTSKIVRSQGVAPLQVDWKIFATKNGLRILDVIINGVSMSLTYRTEYANTFNARGGTIEGLLKAMQSKEVMPVTAP